MERQIRQDRVMNITRHLLSLFCYINKQIVYKKKRIENFLFFHCSKLTLQGLFNYSLDKQTLRNKKKLFNILYFSMPREKFDYLLHFYIIKERQTNLLY